MAGPSSHSLDYPMKWLVVALLWVVALLNYLDRQVIFSLFPLLQQDLHATTFQLGLISTVFLTAYGLLSPFAGYLADRAGHVKVILVSLVVWSGATWFTAHVHSIPQLLWTRALMGISEAFYLPAGLALIADRHGPKTRSLATGLHQTGLYTGIVLGGTWGGWMGDHSGWRPVFQVLGVVGAVYFIVLFFALRTKDASRTPDNFLESLSLLIRSREFRPLVLAFTAASVANWILYTWLPLFLYERFHLSLTSAGFSATFFIQAASYVGVIVGGTISDRWATKTNRARIYCQMIGLSIAAPFLVLLSITTLMPILIPALVTYGLGRGIFDCNTMPAVRETLPPDLSATAYGILNMTSCLAGGLAAAGAGWMKQHVGLAAAFQLAAAIMVFGTIVLNLPIRKGSLQ
jgi:MFS family permease